MRILLIRHGLTAGNQAKRYIGKTDEPLCPDGLSALKTIRYPKCDCVISSPLMRCLQTAKIIFPTQQPHICELFRECDFGDFEGKNYADLNGDERYQQWIDSGGTLPFPNGEAPDAFKARCCKGLIQMTHEFASAYSLAMIVHGGTIMAILSQFAVPHRDYYDWMTDNGHGWICDYNDLTMSVMEKL